MLHVALATDGVFNPTRRVAGDDIQPHSHSRSRTRRSSVSSVVLCRKRRLVQATPSSNTVPALRGIRSPPTRNPRSLSFPRSLFTTHHFLFLYTLTRVCRALISSKLTSGARAAMSHLRIGQGFPFPTDEPMLAPFQHARSRLILCCSLCSFIVHHRDFCVRVRRRVAILSIVYIARAFGAQGGLQPRTLALTCSLHHNPELYRRLPNYRHDCR